MRLYPRVLLRKAEAVRGAEGAGRLQGWEHCVQTFLEENAAWTGEGGEGAGEVGGWCLALPFLQPGVGRQEWFSCLSLWQRELCAERAGGRYGPWGS